MRRRTATPTRMSHRCNATCLSCHTQSDGDTMHNGKLSNANAQAVKNVTCIDCHGGNQVAGIPAGIKKGDPQFEHFKLMAHVERSRPDIWPVDSARNPEVLGGKSLLENVDYIRFVNPGDLRAAQASCGACHNTEAEGHIVDKVRRSMMTTGALLWEAALYNNGAAAQDRCLRRKLHPRRQAGEASSHNPAHGLRRDEPRHDRGALAATATGRSPSRATSCASLSAAEKNDRSSACPIPKKIPENPKSNYPIAALARTCEPIRSGSACRKPACSIPR